VHPIICGVPDPDVAAVPLLGGRLPDVKKILPDTLAYIVIVYLDATVPILRIPHTTLLAAGPVGECNVAAAASVDQSA
jgi:hypothetical protein